MALQKLTIISSNSIEGLSHELLKRVYKNKDPFLKRKILIPSEPLRHTLMGQFVKEDNGILAGLKIGYFHELVGEWTKQEKTFPSRVSVAIVLQEEIAKEIDRHPLFEELRALKNSMPLKAWEKASTRLAYQIAEEFYYYAHFAPLGIEEWERQELSCWQQFLWKKVYGEKSLWTYEAKAVKDLDEEKIKRGEIHLFAISFLPKVQLDFLKACSEFAPVYIYQFSPSMRFWTDLLSPHAQAALWKKIQKERVGEEVKENLTELLAAQNPLMASWSKAARSTVSYWHEHAIDSIDAYIAPATIKGSDYEELLDEEECLIKKAPLSLLNCVKLDLLLLRDPMLPIAVKEEKASIEKHECPSLKREMEVVVQRIRRILSEDPTLEPKDIGVAVAGMERVERELESLLKESRIPFFFFDRLKKSEDLHASSFHDMLAFLKGKMSKEEVLYYLENPLVQAKYHLRPSDLEEIKKWILQAGISWGYNQDHRLKLTGLSKTPAKDWQLGTWEAGIENLFEGLIHSNSDSSASLLKVPVELTSLELLNTFISLIKNLYQEKELYEKTGLQEWSEWLHHLLRSYQKLYVSEADEKEDEYEKFLERFEPLFNEAKDLTNTISFAALEVHLQHLLKEKFFAAAPDDLNAVSFMSLKPFRPTPRKVLFLAGLDETAFPKVEEGRAWNAISLDKWTERPTLSELDRFAFLEQLLSAEEKLILSFSTHIDGEKVNPAPLLQEICDYIRDHFIEGETLVKNFQHFKKPYAKEYFKQESPLFGLSHEVYYPPALQKPLESLLASTGSSVIPNNPGKDKQESGPIHLSIKEMEQAVKKPTQLFFSQAYGLSFFEEEIQEEALFVNPLTRWKIFNANDRKSRDKKIQELKSLGLFPLGFLGQLEEKRLEEEYEEKAGEFSLRELKPKKIELIPGLKEPVNRGKVLFLPALECSVGSQEVLISGSFEWFENEGILGRESELAKGLLRAWPQLLIASELYDRGWLLEKPQFGLFNKPNKISVESQGSEFLQKMVEYTLFVKNQLVPLKDEWVPYLVQQDKEGFIKAYEKSLNGFYEQTDSSLELALDVLKIEPESIYEEHHEKVKKCFEEVMRYV